MSLTALTLLALSACSSSPKVTPTTAATPLTTDNPWPRALTIAPGEPESIGRFAAGCLRGGESIDTDSTGFQLVRLTRNRHYGHPFLVSFLRTKGTEVKAAGERDFLIGDMGMPRGGPTLSGHASHQTGLDVDIWYQRFGRKLNATEKEKFPARLLVDREKKAVKASTFTRDAVKLLRRFASAPEVDRIFVNFEVKKYLCDHFKDEPWLHRVRPWYGHDYHFHVRLACAVSSPLCEMGDPVPEGDGCDTTLAWWWTDEAKIQEKPKSLAPPVMPKLPEACEAVLRM